MSGYARKRMDRTVGDQRNIRLQSLCRLQESPKKTKSRRCQSERLEQKAFFRWLSLYPKIRCVSWATPNGGSRHVIEAANLKAEGVTSGVPDVLIAIPSKGYHGLFIEFKAGVNKLTESQEKMRDKLLEKGYAHFVCYSWLEAKEVATDYLGEILNAR